MRKGVERKRDLKGGRKVGVREGGEGWKEGGRERGRKGGRERGRKGEKIETSVSPPVSHKV